MVPILARSAVEPHFLCSAVSSFRKFSWVHSVFLSHIPVSGITHDLCVRVVCCSVIYLKIFLFVCCGGRGYVHTCRTKGVSSPGAEGSFELLDTCAGNWALVHCKRRSSSVVLHCRGTSPAAYGVCLKTAVIDVTNDQHFLPETWRPEVRSQHMDSTIALCRPFLSSPRCWLLPLTHRVPSLSSCGLLTCLSS